MRATQIKPHTLTGPAAIAATPPQRTPLTTRTPNNTTHHHRSYLSAYDWARGGTVRDRNVSIELPTDADLVMHVFLWRCDSLSEHRLSELDQPFVKQHFLQTMPGDESCSLRGRNLIVRHGSAPPYFYVVENGAVHRVPRGKDNALAAIVLFLLLARRDRWLPTYNPGYRRLLEVVFGSAFDRSPLPPAANATVAGAGVGRLSSTPEAVGRRRS